ncbi:glycosyltransferase family 1 protein [Arthrobacter sp. CJ23]|uniref:glycosyltransferase family 4 protein n=1 Tax=Arthrobacter sp. CJ23 TaxID=2972479 RepID=UPI00215D3081|nr:glycosyltransferase family 1 protein [Arthrobacter sp. CJ23]UVJ38740.1 glycosyltransferase family 4 protein [Arthrobacter sp. CJ23]
MKLLFDAYWLVNGPPSGRTVVREIVQAWCQQFPEDEILLLVRRVDRALVEDLDFVRNSQISVLDTRAPIHALAVITMRIPSDVDAVVTQNFTPLLRHRATKATFLHDGIFRQHPAWFTAKERIYLSLATLSVGAANLVLTSTATESRRIQKYFYRTRNKTHAVGLGLPSWVSSRSEEEPIPATQAKPYLLAVGRLNVRKNIQALIHAFESTSAVDDTFDMVIVGEPNGKNATIGRKSNSIHFRSGVSDSELRDLYRGAAGFIFPSLDEGFGLPLLEAASFNLPIAASDIDVFREIDLAHVYFDPKDVRSISSGLHRLVNSDLPSESVESRLRIDRALTKYNWAAVVGNMRRTLRMEGRGRCAAS